MWYIYKNQKYFTIISVASARIKVIPIIFLTEFCLKGYWEINIYKHFQSVSKFFFLMYIFQVCFICSSFLLESESRSVVSNSLWLHGLWNSLGQNTGVGCHSLFHGIFLIQGSNPGLLHCRWSLYCWATREAQEYWNG